MISEKLIIQHAPKVIGEQIHINHEGCEAGEDHKRRLYIKRVERGILAFCHHCQEYGFVRGDSRKERLSRHKEDIKLPAPIPRNISEDIIDEISSDGIMWLFKYGIEHPETYFFKGIKGNTEQLALKLLDANGDNIGWQIRNLDRHPPKYITKLFNTEKGNSSWFNQPTKKLVITEDYLSAYKICLNTTEYSSVALLKTSITDKTLMQISELAFEEIVIWLDPDEAGISGASKAYKKLRYFLPPTTKIFVVATEKEPKQCSKEEIERILSSITTS